MIDVLFIVLPDTLLLDLAGPAEAFRLANQQLHRRGQPDRFRMRFAGPQTQVTSSVGLQLAALEPLPASLPTPTWVMLLGRPGEAADVVAHQPAWLAARDWLARTLGPAMDGADATPHRLLTVCSGALLVADAGLIGRRRVTTHHELLDDLARLAPAAQVQGNQLFVEDGPLLSSAGVTAGIDLALHCIAGVCGDALVAAVAQVMVVFTRRTGQAPQCSALLAHRDHLHPALHRVQDAVGAQPQQDWSAERLAAVAHVTPRHLNRLFQEFTGLTPRAYVESVRLALANQALARGGNDRAAAELAGFSSARQLRAVLRRARVAA